MLRGLRLRAFWAGRAGEAGPADGIRGQGVQKRRSRVRRREGHYDVSHPWNGPALCHCTDGLLVSTVMLQAPADIAYPWLCCRRLQTLEENSSETL